MNADLSYSLDGRGQQSATCYALSEPEKRMRVLDLSVGLLIVRTELGEIWSEGFTEVARALQELPLAGPEFRAAKRHLDNAVNYCDADEFGAATFELRVVRGILQRL
jgi:hypothetical protein